MKKLLIYYLKNTIFRKCTFVHIQIFSLQKKLAKYTHSYKSGYILTKPDKNYNRRFKHYNIYLYISLWNTLLKKLKKATR